VHCLRDVAKAVQSSGQNHWIRSGVESRCSLEMTAASAARRELGGTRA